MKINFENITTKELQNFKGGEKYLSTKMFVDDNNKIMNAHLIPGASIGLHTHNGSSEIIFITSGTGKVICDGITELLQKGDCHYCPEGSSHTLINDGDQNLCFVAVVPTHNK